MIFTPLALHGVYRIDLQSVVDERGWFARTWCQSEFDAHGLVSQISQCNVSVNRRRGTVRGMHFQATPHEEVKVVRCSRGRIFDVVIDLRPSSPTYRRSLALELDAQVGTTLYVPKGLAHGFQTLEDDSEVVYFMSEPYVPHAARGVGWDDPAFDVKWPLPITSISPKDLGYPRFVP